MPSSLEILDVSYNEFTGGLPLGWSSLTKIKELKMTDCGLDGACGLPKRAAADVN